jgi:tRNA (guanine37-N1)-methyltransferase
MERTQLKKNLKRNLADKFEPKQLNKIYKTYDIVGEIAVIRVPENLRHYSKLIAEAIMKIHREVKGVWRQSSAIAGDYRLRQLEFLLGEKITETVHREHGCKFKIDLERVYFSPRLSYERARIAKLVQPREVVLNMFAGVGCFSISIAKHSEPLKVYSVDINPVAIHFLNENIRLNRVAGVVVSIQGDAEQIISTELLNVADRVLMPLPERSYEYLDCALSALKQTGGWIHYYSFEHARKDEDPIRKVEIKVTKRLQNLGASFHLKFGRIVRSIGPRWFQVVLDIQVGS